MFSLNIAAIIAPIALRRLSYCHQSKCSSARMKTTIDRRSSKFLNKPNSCAASFSLYNRPNFTPSHRLPAPNNAYSFLNTIAYHFNDDDDTTPTAMATGNVAMNAGGASTTVAAAVVAAAAALAASGTACVAHDHELLKPQLISTWMPNGVGSMPGKRTIFAETQVSWHGGI